MGFGFGPGAEMHKTFESLRRKPTSAFENMSEHNGNSGTELHFDKKATPEQLKEIRQQIQKENQKKLLYRIVFFVLFAMLLIYFLS